MLKLNWENLNKDMCPKCSAELAAAQKDGGLLRCRCGFVISIYKVIEIKGANGRLKSFQRHDVENLLDS